MAAGFSLVPRRALMPLRPHLTQPKANLSTVKNVGNSTRILAAAGVIATGAAGLAYALNESVKAADLELHPPKFPWSQAAILGAHDMNSVRRGYQVYKQVCSACHGLKYVAYREMVNCFLTEDEAKREAAEVMVEDGPDEAGKMFMRPGKLSDKVPSPYPNEEAARYANNGALPPDLSLIVLARHGKEDYIFSLLTGYAEAPAGVKIENGQHFNPYFIGGAISMAQALYNEAIEYEDGTPATASQLAKDVTNFLSWCAQPENDMRKRAFIKVMAVTGMLFFAFGYWKRFVWSSLKTRKVIYRPTPPKQDP